MLEMMHGTEDSGPQVIFLKRRLLSLTFPARGGKGSPCTVACLLPCSRAGPGPGLSHPTDTVLPRRPVPSLTRGICPRPPSCSHLQALFAPGSPGLFLPSSSLPVSPTLGSLITRKGPFRAQPAAHLLWPEVLPQPASPTAFLEHLRPGRPCPPLLACPVPVYSILPFLSGRSSGLCSSRPRRGPKPTHIYLLPSLSLLCSLPPILFSVLGRHLASKLTALGSDPHVSSASSIRVPDPLPPPCSSTYFHEATRGYPPPGLPHDSLLFRSRNSTEAS